MSSADQPRAALTQQFSAKPQSFPDIGLGTPPLFDQGRLSLSERRRFEQHLAEREPRTGLTYAELYVSRTFTSVAQTVVYGARGTAPKLLWMLGVAGDEKRVTIPAFAVKALTVDDITDPVIALKFRRDRAQVAVDRATEERARRAGRTSGERLGELKEKESLATGVLLELDAEYQAAVAERVRAEQAELTDANEPWTQGFEAEQDRLFDAEFTGVPLTPLADRRSAADSAATAAKQASDAAHGRLALWMSVEMVRMRASGFVVRV